VNAHLVGRRELVVVDPGDPSDEAASTLIGEAERRGGRIAAIALTHADPDHAAGAEALALRLDVPIFAGPGARRPLPYDVVELPDGARVPAGDVALTVVTTPGPRPDHVAYVVGETQPLTIVAGDLVGGRADRAILGPRDLAAWRASVGRLGGLRPGRLLPGHGEPLGPEALEAPGGP
jgi:glyoxylase-like metal-dependent hydrolase (beta-lactamase superfamily II)